MRPETKEYISNLYNGLVNFANNPLTAAADTFKYYLDGINPSSNATEQQRADATLLGMGLVGSAAGFIKVGTAVKPTVGTAAKPAVGAVKPTVGVAKPAVGAVPQPYMPNSSSTSILHNGYYEVNGLKFSEFYYQKLWATGRGAPSLVAQDILKNVTVPSPDLKAGFFRYEFGGWEMIHNPTTKEIWHLQQKKGNSMEKYNIYSLYNELSTVIEKKIEITFYDIKLSNNIYEAEEAFQFLNKIQSFLAKLVFKYDVPLSDKLSVFVYEIDRIDDDDRKKDIYNKIKLGINCFEAIIRSNS